jgi:hypothetical protein
LIGLVRFGVGHPGADSFSTPFWLGAMAAVLAGGAVLSWRAFLRLEAIDGAGADIQMPRWFKADRPARRHPFWLLLWKELHLQQMTFVVGVLFCIGWAALSLLKDLVPSFADAPLVPVTIVYLVLLSILIGSLASAEERQLGVLQWQVLLPMAAWQQWMLKVGVALGLALLMGVALPILLNYVSPGPERFDLPHLWRANALTVTVLTSLSLYVSSLSTSGVRAVMFSFPALLALAGMAQVLYARLLIPETWLVMPPRGAFVPPRPDSIPLAILGALVVVALCLAYQNHRSADRSFRQAARQMIWFLAVPVGGVLVVAGIVVVRMFLIGSAH